MRNTKKLIALTTRICLSMILLSAMTVTVWAQTVTNFSGTWKQDNDRSQPKRNGDVTLHIDQHESEITVETSIARASGKPGHAIQKYKIGGETSVSTGADGDEFHTSVIWKDSSLVFTIEEHEDGKILHSQETWSILENGATLQRVRERSPGDKQTLIYSRNP